MHPSHASLPDPADFLECLFAAIRHHCYLEVSTYPLDHICYRVETTARYVELKEQLSQENELLAETMINGRPIATFRLAVPFTYHDRRIELLELPSPKPGSKYREGYDHVEFVVGKDPGFLLEQYPELDWDTKGMAKAVNKDLRFKFADGTSVKFHEFPLDYVIAHLD